MKVLFVTMLKLLRSALYRDFKTKTGSAGQAVAHRVEGGCQIGAATHIAGTPHPEQVDDLWACIDDIGKVIDIADRAQKNQLFLL